MFPNKLGVFAHLALVGSAILIPPSITSDDLGDYHALATLPIDPLKRSFILECPSCPLLKEGNSESVWELGVGNAFSLEFEIGSRGDTLMLGDLQLYPPSFNDLAKSFRVTQVNPEPEYASSLLVSGFKFHYDSAETVSEAGMELLPMTLQITSVEMMPVTPPVLTINVLKDTEGNLMIASFQVGQGVDNTPADQEKDCNQWPLFCEWKKILGNKIDKLKNAGTGCQKRPHGHAMEEDQKSDQAPHWPRPGKPHHHHRPHHMGHGGHHHHHKHPHVLSFLRRAFFTILVPVLIGIFAGTLTYLIGMALGCLIAIIIAKVRGQSYERIPAEEDDVEGSEIGDDKDGCAELPGYDAPPNYEEAADQETDEPK